jgi:uncharacterized lipoprotein YmbA
MTARKYVLWWIGALPFLGACSFLKARPDPTKYFVLTSEARKGPAAPAKALGVDRIELPEYLMRPQMTTRTEANQLKIAEYDRWAESLKDGLSRTLRHDLEKQLGERVLTAPFDPAQKPALVADVEVRRFERVLPVGAVLEATWTLRDGATGAVLVTQEANLRQPVAGDDASAAVAALSTTVAALAAQIADAVRTRS